MEEVVERWYRETVMDDSRDFEESVGIGMKSDSCQGDDAREMR